MFYSVASLQNFQHHLLLNILGLSSHIITLWVMKWDGQFVVNADFNSTFRL